MSRDVHPFQSVFEFYIGLRIVKSNWGANRVTKEQQAVWCNTYIPFAVNVCCVCIFLRFLFPVKGG